jgi:hypothetical protein
LVFVSVWLVFGLFCFVCAGFLYCFGILSRPCQFCFILYPKGEEHAATSQQFRFHHLRQCAVRHPAYHSPTHSTGALQELHTSPTGVLQQLYRNSTGALQEFYRSSTGAQQELCRSSTGALQEPYRSSTGALNKPCRSSTGALQELYMSSTGVLQELYRNFYRSSTGAL